MHVSAPLSILAITGLASSSPLTTRDTAHDLAPSQIKIIETGYYNASKASSLKDVPPECSFLGPRYDFAFSKFDAGSHRACIAHQLGVGMSCGGGAWPDADYRDMVSAVSQQVTKDGQFTNSKAGRWMATFDLLTTAVPDRKAYFTYFQWGLNFGGQKTNKWTRYFFSYDKNYMTISKTSVQC